MKTIVGIICVMAAVMCLGGSARGTMTSRHLLISGEVDAFAEWADGSGVVVQGDWDGPINAVKQKRHAVSPMVLYSNVDTVISARPGLNGGVLTLNGETLETAYRLTGAVSSPDAAFKPAAEFFSSGNTYRVVHVAGTGAYVVNLEVEMGSPADTAPERGVYVCGLEMTAAW